MKGFKTYFTFLQRNKLFTIINVAGLAVSLMFILLIADMVTRQLTIDSNVKDADRIFIMANERVTYGHYQLGILFENRYPEIEAWSSTGESRSLLCRYTDESLPPILLYSAFVRDNFFDFFGFSVIKGDARSCLLSDRNVVLTQSAAMKLFGTDDVLGKTLRMEELDNNAYTITGIVEDFDNSIFPAEIEAIFPQVNIKYVDEYEDIDDQFMVNESAATLFFKFAPGYDPATKNADMLDLMKGTMFSYRSGSSKELQLVPMHDFYFSEVRSVHVLNQYDFSKVIVFLVAGIIIMLMAVLNYVSMSVAQTSYRAKEMATRRLLGSSPADIFCRMIAESFVITSVAFAVGLLLAAVAEPYAMELLDVRLNIFGDFSWGYACCWLLFLLVLSAVGGFVPAMMLSRYAPLDVVKGTFRRKTKMVYLRVLNVVQCGFLIALLSCSLYLGKQIHDIRYTPLGYECGNVIEYPSMTDAKQVRSFKTEVGRLPFVKAVALSRGLPVNMGNNMTMPVESGDSVVHFSFQVFEGDTSFLDMFHIEITEDRKLANRENAFYISEKSLADYARLGLGTEKISCNYTIYIAGQFKDFKIGSLLRKRQYPTLIKVSLTDSIMPESILVETIDGDLAQYKSQIDAMYAEFVDNYPFESKWYADMLDDVYSDVYALNKIIVIFTCVALIISLLGLTAMNVYMISQRKRDIAVRKVFGSTAREEQLRLLRFSLKSVVCSLVIAIPLAVVGMIKIYDFVPYGDLRQWWIPIVAFAIVAAVSLVSVFLIGRKAMKENPIENIKTE